MTTPVIAVTPGPKELTRLMARAAFVRAREAARLTQEQLAVLLDVSASTVKAWESESEATSKPVPLRLLYDVRVPSGLRRVLLATIEVEADSGAVLGTIAELGASLVACADVIRGIGAAIADGIVTPAEAEALMTDVLRCIRVLERALRALAATAGGAK